MGAASANGLAASFPEKIEVFHWHGDTFDIPAGALHLARSEGCANQAYIYGDRVVGLQFHLETTPASAQQLITHCGKEIVEGRYIRTSQEMLKDPRRFDTIDRVMHDLLVRLAAETPEQSPPICGEAG